jgi:hypothetical protein
MVARMRLDATWLAGGHKYWRRHGAPNVEAVDRGDAHQLVTPVASGIVG